MSRAPRFRRAALGAICATGFAVSALAQDDDSTRAVRIIEDAPLTSPTESANTPPAAVAPATVAPAPVPAAPTFEIGKEPLKAENTAGLSVEILPGAEFEVGTRIAFRITTKRPGYLLLVDIDASGKLTQIYPNRSSLLALGGRESANLIKPGRTVTIPDRGNPLAGFEFVAAPPNGVAMVIAILSDRPVQMIDLPDVPQQFAGRAAALKYITELAQSLRIPRGDESGALQEAKWSFDAKFYVIR